MSAPSGSLAQPLSSSTVTALFEEALPSVRASRVDLATRPDRWPTAFSLPVVEALLRDPLTVPAWAVTQTDAVRRATTSAQQLSAAASALSISLPDPYRSHERTALARVMDVLAHSQVLLQKSFHSMTPEQRATVETVWTEILTNHESQVDAREAVAAAQPFNQTALLQAARDVCLAIDEALPELASEEKPKASVHRERRKYPGGEVILAGGAIQDFTSPDTEAALILNFSSKSRYSSPPARARNGAIRIVIDWAQEVTLEAPDADHAAGSGVFGIGLFYAPTRSGTKTICTGDFSQGFGLFGVGGFFASAAHSLFSAGDGAQGAGVFGLGLFSNDFADQTEYRLRYAGQGLGLTRGVGAFLHRGSDGAIEGGLREPDPREPLAFVSLCQGVGYGPRAYAAGGVGWALVEGDRNRVSSSYFSQGSGYWHGLGAFFLRGHKNQIQARRYGQGSGVHTAVGAFVLEGDRNQTINWGVGPAYGWDLGLGTFLSSGDDNAFQTEWGSGHGEMNGHALALIQGQRNRLALADFGSGSFNRQMPSYGVTLLRGEGHRVRCPVPSVQPNAPFEWRWNAWGVLQTSGSVTLDPAMPLLKPVWPVPAREAAADEERRVGERLLQHTEKETLDQQVSHWLMLATQAGLDEQTPRDARRHLFSLDEQGLAALAARMAPDRYEEWIQARLLFCTYGTAARQPLVARLQESDPLIKVMMLNLLMGSRADAIEPEVEKALKDADWRVRKTATVLLASFVDCEEGDTPGRRTWWSRFEAVLRHSQDGKAIGPVLWTDAFALVSLDPSFTVENRIQLAEVIRDPWSPLSSEAQMVFVNILLAHADRYRPLVRVQEEWADAHRQEIRQRLRGLLHDPEPEVRLAAIGGLGEIGDVSDAPVIALFLADSRALLREGAASALGKMGPAAQDVIQHLLLDPSPSTRAMAALAAAQSWSASVALLIEPALSDASEQVRLTALSAMTTLSPNLRKAMTPLKPTLRQDAQNDASSSVRALAQYLDSLL